MVVAGPGGFNSEVVRSGSDVRREPWRKAGPRRRPAGCRIRRVCQSAIAAVHDEAPDAGATDWPQIVALYELLTQIAPNPMVTLSRAVAVAMVSGPRAGLDLLATLDADDRMTAHHRLHAVRAHLQEMAGDLAAARTSYRSAARRTTSLPERRYLEARAARLAR